MRAKKHLGQHFLEDRFILSEIICHIKPRKQEPLIEIGPGYGALTKLLVPLVNDLSVIEIDPDCVQHLMPIKELTIHHADILAFDWSLVSEPSKIVGNLPYNIATEIFFVCLQNKEKIKEMNFMMQKEVANRLIAKPGSKAYGKLSVMIQSQATIDLLFDIPPTAFKPEPKVMSSFCRLVPRKDKLSQTKIALLNQVVSAAFSRRRKQCHHNFKQWLNKSDLLQLDIDPSCRAENIDVTSYLKLTDRILNFKQKKQ